MKYVKKENVVGPKNSHKPKYSYYKKCQKFKKILKPKFSNLDNRKCLLSIQILNIMWIKAKKVLCWTERSKIYSKIGKLFLLNNSWPYNLDRAQCSFIGVFYRMCYIVSIQNYEGITIEKLVRLDANYTHAYLGNQRWFKNAPHAKI